MTPFDLLRQHVHDHPDAVAASTPYRIATYRKMWSRIERSTARLQGEWGIRPGDTIAYYGCGHLDALVMYFAAARCGARVLPLEHAALQAEARSLIAATDATLVLFDDALALGPETFAITSRPLSSLIATVCRHRAIMLEDSAALSLLEFAQEDEGSKGSGASGAVTSVMPMPRTRSLDALAAAARTCPAGHHRVIGALFDASVFAPVVLATLLAGETLVFAEPLA
ncbi:MAG: AMP-binding protein [Herminiimonas sp.]|nr:AMP-binding protein [Herminiimonas sp.]